MDVCEERIYVYTVGVLAYLVSDRSQIGLSVYFCATRCERRVYARANCTRQTAVQFAIRRLSGHLPSIGVIRGHWKISLSPPQKHFWGGETVERGKKISADFYVTVTIYVLETEQLFSMVYLLSNLHDNAMHSAGQWILILFH